MDGGFDIRRRIVAHATSRSWRTIPHVSFLYEPDITEFHAVYRRLREGDGTRSGRGPSFNTLLLKAVAEGLAAAPSLNARFDYNPVFHAGRLRIRRSIDVTVPWMAPDGRMVSLVVPDADGKTLAALTAYMADLDARLAVTDVDALLWRTAWKDTADRLRRMDLSVLDRVLTVLLGKGGRRRPRGGARRKRGPGPGELTAADVMTGTVVVSNVGSLYGDLRGSFTLLEVLPTNVFAVGIGAVQDRPGVAPDGNGGLMVAVRRILPMCLVFDHRAVDFDSLLPFIRRLDGIFVDPGIVESW